MLVWLQIIGRVREGEEEEEDCLSRETFPFLRFSSHQPTKFHCFTHKQFSQSNRKVSGGKKFELEKSSFKREWKKKCTDVVSVQKYNNGCHFLKRKKNCKEKKRTLKVLFETASNYSNLIKTQIENPRRIPLLRKNGGTCPWPEWLVLLQQQQLAGAFFPQIFIDSWNWRNTSNVFLKDLK